VGVAAELRGDVVSAQVGDAEVVHERLGGQSVRSDRARIGVGGERRRADRPAGERQRGDGGRDRVQARRVGDDRAEVRRAAGERNARHAAEIAARDDAGAAAWRDAITRRHRATRETLEAARAVLAATRRGRRGGVERGERLLVIVETIDQIFGVLIAVEEVVDNLSAEAWAAIGAELRAGLTAASARLDDVADRVVVEDALPPLPPISEAGSREPSPAGSIAWGAAETRSRAGGLSALARAEVDHARPRADESLHIGGRADASDRVAGDGNRLGPWPERIEGAHVTVLQHEIGRSGLGRPRPWPESHGEEQNRQCQWTRALSLKHSILRQHPFARRFPAAPGVAPFRPAISAAPCGTPPAKGP
jgi:hypothetical protein